MFLIVYTGLVAMRGFHPESSSPEGRRLERLTARFGR